MLRRIIAMLFGLVAGWSVYGLVESKLLATDDVAPTTKQTAPIQLDSQTESFLKTITTACAQPFTLSGSLQGDFDVAGQVDRMELKFTSTFGGSNRIRHQSTDLLIVSDSKNISIFDHKANLFSTSALDTSHWSKNVISILEMQNPALLVAIKGDARSALFPSGAKLVESSFGNESSEIKIENDGVAIRYQFDSGGHFQAIDYDFTQYLERQGVTGIGSAAYKITYDKPAPANIDDDTFNFVAPAGARDLAKEPRQIMPQSATEQLLNKPAPPFEGRDLNGNIIGLSGFKDRIVVLDFWATWCGPCKPALEHLKTYRKRFDEDVTVLTINCEGADDLDETARKVRDYFEKNDFDFNTLLDDGSISQTYTVTALPTRLLIGRDGMVKKVAVGAGSEANKTFDDAVEAALKE